MMRRLFNSWALSLLTILTSSCAAEPAISQSSPAPITQATSTPEQPEEESKLIRDYFVDDDRLTYLGYEVVKLEKSVKDKYPSEINSPPRMIDVTYAVLKKNGRVLAKFEGVYFGMGNETEFGLFPFLGGETKQLIVSQTIFRGGRHWIVSLTPSFRVVYDSNEYDLGREEMRVLDIDNDGVYEVSQELTTFVFFEDITRGSTHIIDIVLKYDERAKKYLPASHIFQDYTLAGVKDRPVSLNRADEKSLASDVLRLMLPYIYAGRREEAWDYYNREYTLPNKEELKAKIMAALKEDAVYNYIYR
ncbi:MAG TPA: hypothetical protein VIQ24_16805 [Pyrinomonadaceae bacterium]